MVVPLAETQKSLPSGSRSTVHAMPSAASSCCSTTTASVDQPPHLRLGVVRLEVEVKADPLPRRGRDTLETQLDTPCVHEDVLP
jgi:hypothetical protein